MHDLSTVCHILQIPCNEKNHGLVFTGMAMRENVGIPYPNITEYEHVYDLECKGEVKLEDVFRVLNINHPADYKARSLSVSDVVIIDRDGVCTAYFCDTVGFVKLDWGFFMKPAEAQ